MGSFFETVTDLEANAETLRRRRYGVIEISAGRLVGVHLRPWPKLVSLVSVLGGQGDHKPVGGDRMWRDYNQPPACANFLGLTFGGAARGTTWATAQQA